ncbi:Protein kinase-like domain [Pseudocohnilembus persalinus]|uniref:non-specific serine/threonine protein kinase n=1 Tax=Pseudocohnilembus persalinus TaxID=266149 RepID=A0A0V0QR22_PSEPJ|nr:Protein kinase-like domain [Pseudocohnilembus persalinus]|eukprot:KRX04754.1 Protein kinase-like domain [Pseudocohnilembus persalinus]
MEDLEGIDQQHNFQRQKFFLIEAPENVINNSQKGRYWKTFSNICRKLNESFEQKYEVLIFFRSRGNNAFKGCAKQLEKGYILDGQMDERKACYMIEVKWIYKTEINIRDINDIIHTIDPTTYGERIQQGSVLYHKIGQKILNFGKQFQLSQNKKVQIRQQTMQKKYRMRSPSPSQNRGSSNQSNNSNRQINISNSGCSYAAMQKSSSGSVDNNQQIQIGQLEQNETQNYKDINKSKDSQINMVQQQKPFKGNQDLVNEYEAEIKKLQNDVKNKNQIIQTLQQKQIIELQNYEIKILKLEQQLKDYQDILKKNDIKDYFKQNLEMNLPKILDDEKIDKIVKDNIIKNELQLKLLEDMTSNSSRNSQKIQNLQKILYYIPANQYVEQQYLRKGGFASIYKGIIKRNRQTQMASNSMSISDELQHHIPYEDFNTYDQIIEEECVIKKFCVNLDNMEQIKFFFHEILMLAKIPIHKNIIKVLGYSVNYEELKNQQFKIMEKKLECKIFLEYAQEGNLHDFILKNKGFQQLRHKAQQLDQAPNSVQQQIDLQNQSQQQQQLLQQQLQSLSAENRVLYLSAQSNEYSLQQQQLLSQLNQPNNNSNNITNNNNNFSETYPEIQMDGNNEYNDQFPQVLAKAQSNNVIIDQNLISSGNFNANNTQISQQSTNSSSKVLKIDPNIKQVRQIKLKMCIQISDGLMELHKNNIMHLDIKPDNILINKAWTAKITDFGISKQIESTKVTSIIGQTIRYMPHEYQSEVVSHKTDIWSLGCIFYFIFSEQEPWSGCTNLQIAKRLNEKCDFFQNNNMEKCDLISDVLKHCLVHDHKKRWDAFQINLELRKLLDQLE